MVDGDGKLLGIMSGLEKIVVGNGKVYLLGSGDKIGIYDNTWKCSSKVLILFIICFIGNILCVLFE